MPSIHTEISIDAPAEVVWAELVDLKSYADWNSFVLYTSGEPQVGERLVLKIKQPTGSTFTIKPTVTERVENKKFQWLGSLLMPGIFDGRHSFEIIEREGGVTFKHYENFGGILAFPMGWIGIYRKTRPGFDVMNQEIKKRAEVRVSSGDA